MTQVKVHQPIRASIKTDSNAINMLLFWLAHAPLGLALFLGPSIIATVHGLMVLAFGIYWAITPVPMSRIAYVGAYIVGAEVLWRMTGASLFWEFGKYAVILILLLGILRNKQAKFPILPTLYFLFLLPAAVLTLSSVSPPIARAQISFNLSGPLALTVAAWFFSQVNISRNEIRDMLSLLIAPIISIASILLFVVLTTTDIRWVNDSNFQTSAGFGPNQVSTALGLGLLCVILLISSLRQKSSPQIFLIILTLWFLGQGLLTFSRGGVLAGVIASAIAIIYTIRSSQNQRLNVLIPFVILIALGVNFVFPVLNDFTGGTLETRFSDLGATGRDSIGEADLSAFMGSPIAGIGVGLGRQYRQNFTGSSAAAHTEYTRVLAEHGLIGVMAYLLLGVALLRNFQRIQNKQRLFVLVFALWSALTFFHSAMRLVAPSFMIGLAFATYIIEERAEDNVSGMNII